MSRNKRILIIIQLCLAFSFLSWLFIQPWVREMVSRQSEMSLYEMISERKTLFEALPEGSQERIIAGYEAALSRPKPPVGHKLGHLFFVETSPFALAWLFFSIVVSVLLLMRIEGAQYAVWLLPLCVAAYAYFLQPPEPKETHSLFPSEEYVLAHYPEDEGNQRQRLLSGWHRYLITEWGDETPSLDNEMRAAQLDRALFAFNVARIEWLLDGKGDAIITAGFTSPPSSLRLLLYFIWNSLFAWFMSRRPKFAAQSLQSSSTSP